MLFLKTSNIVTPLHTYFIFRLCVRRCTVTILSKVKAALGAGARVVKGKVVLSPKPRCGLLYAMLAGAVT